MTTFELRLPADRLIPEGTSLIITGPPPKSYTIGLVEPSPCTNACPAGVNVKAYVSLIAAGRFAEALEVIRERNPLPGICGRVCTHPCEAVCNRNQVDSPVAIRWLKRFAADWELTNSSGKPAKIKTTRPEKVAVIGSGPSGLTAANDLVRQGFDVTIFEALPEAGGMLRVGIPAFRLPRNILTAEIDYLQNMGIKIKTGQKISGKDALQKLFERGFKAIYLAIGAQAGKKLSIRGEPKRGTLDAVTFLNEVNLAAAGKPGNNVIIIGGGNAAVDSARTALRLGCENVQIVYRRTRQEMPADEEEIVEAEHEGVKITYLATPVELIKVKDRTTGLKCRKMKLGESDESGRRRPVPIEGSEYVIECDTVIAAVSQELRLDFGLDDIEQTHWNTVLADENTMATTMPGVFAGGDAVSGPSTVINAIAAGHRAAGAISRYLTGKPLVAKSPPKSATELEIKIPFDQRPAGQRAAMPAKEISERLGNFDEIEFGFDEATAVAEAQRCLRCGPCTECDSCVALCDKQPVMLAIPDQFHEYFFRVPKELQKQIKAHDGLPATLQTGKTSAIPVVLRSLQPEVATTVCRGCGECVRVCPYEAVHLIAAENNLSVSQVDSELCRSCGICVAACPNGAMLPGHTDYRWLDARLAQIKPGEINLVVFSCRWNGSSLAATEISKLQATGVNLNLIQTTCGGRIEPGFVLRAISAGATGVLITTCADADCHYGTGASRTKASFEEIKNLVHVLGTDTRHIGLTQIPGEDAKQFLQVIYEFSEQLKKLAGN